jgi:DNA-binding response OmpR family regulator
MQTNARILIVEDEQIAAEYLREVLELNDMVVVDICDTGAGAIETARELKPDIIFMDIMLKDGISGSEAALKIASQIETRIIFLTAYSNEEMIEYALDAGAVNYLIKPPDEKQILAAVQIALRHKRAKKHLVHTGCVELGEGYCFSHDSQMLYHHNEEVTLGAKSQRLIRYLCENLDTTVPNAELAEYVYGEPHPTSALRTLISRLRKNLQHDFIHNNSGLGYKISR